MMALTVVTTAATTFKQLHKFAPTAIAKERLEQYYWKRPPPSPSRSGLRSSLRASSPRKLGRKPASGFKNALPAQRLIFFVFFSRVRVWSVVRDGLGESEEGIKDISPLNSTHPSN
jgi:hypothetical protein